MILLRNLAFYTVFYTGSIFLVIAAVLAIPLGQKRFRSFVHAWNAYHRWCARVMLNIQVRVEGEIPEGPVFFAIKHESFFEAIDAPNLFRLPVPFAKDELFRMPGWGIVAKEYGLVPVARDEGATALRKMVAAARAFVAEGRPLVIFPEGKRIPVGERPPMQSGLAGLYKLIGVPLVPVACDSGHLYHRALKRPGTVTYRFAKPIPHGLPRDEVEAKVHAAINALNRTDR